MTITKSFLFIISYLLINCFHSSFSLYPSSSPVINLTPSNFDDLVLESNQLWIVEFFAPWCGHCKNFASEYLKVAEVLNGLVKVGAVDAHSHQSLGQRYNVKGFPTIKFFYAKSNPIEYQGPRTAKGVIDSTFIELRKIINNRLGLKSESSGSGKGLVIEVTDDNFEKVVLKSKEPVFLEFFAPWCGHCKNLEPIWKSVADAVKEEGLAVKIAALDATVNTITAQKYNIQGYPTLKFFLNGEDEEYSGSKSKSDLLEFIKTKVNDLAPPPEVVQILKDKDIEERCSKSQLCVISFFPHILDCDSKCRNNYLDILKQTSERHKKFGYLWTEAMQQPNFESSLGVGGFGYPAMVALNYRKMKYSVLRGPFSKEGIHEFLRDLSYGKGSSAPVPGAKLASIQNVEPWDGKDGELPHISDEL